MKARLQCLLKFVSTYLKVNKTSPNIPIPSLIKLKKMSSRANLILFEVKTFQEMPYFLCKITINKQIIKRY